MKLDDVREILYDVASAFFADATVIWTEQINTKPPLPYVTLTIGAVQRTAYPIIGENGARYYPCSTTAEINLYTKGKSLVSGKNVTGNYVNTATSDLLDFFNYVESESTVDRLARKGVDISLILPVRNLTELQNDSRYRYRAMAEAMITFPVESGGAYGISSMPDTPNSSGGGTEEMAGTEMCHFEEVEVKEDKEEGGNG